MAVEDVLRLEGCSVEEAIGCFEHGRVAARFGQWHPRPLGTANRQRDPPLRVLGIPSSVSANSVTAQASRQKGEALPSTIDVQKKIRERDGMDWTQHERYGMPIARHPNHATLGRRYLS